MWGSEHQLSFIISIWTLCWRCRRKNLLSLRAELSLTNKLIYTCVARISRLGGTLYEQILWISKEPSVRYLTTETRICMNIFSYVHLPLFVYMRNPPTKYSLDPGPYLGPTYDYP